MRSFGFALAVAIASTLGSFHAWVAGPASIDALRGHRRVLLVSTPIADKAAARRQWAALKAWRKGAADRDLKRPYPATQSGRYFLLLEAISLDVDAAFANVSYGAFEILGETSLRAAAQAP